MAKRNERVNQVIAGDCVEVMKGFPSACVDLVVTDPPYVEYYVARDGRTVDGRNMSDWLTPAFAEVYRLLKPDSVCVSFYGWKNVDKFMQAWRSAGFYPVSHMVWVKSYSSRTRFTRSHHESAFVLAKGNPPLPESPLKDVQRWHYSGNEFHPMQKPLSAILPLIEAFSKRGDVVLDPFAGSATTAVAAYQLGREYIAIEKNRGYYESACERLNYVREHIKPHAA